MSAAALKLFAELYDVSIYEPGMAAFIAGLETMKPPRLLYFTNAYPFGLGELWKTNELAELIRTFDDITVIPFSYGGNTTAVPMPPGVKLEGPLVADATISIRWFSLLLILAHPNRGRFLREFLVKRVWKRRSHLINWMSATLNAIRLLDSPIVRNVMAGDHRDTVLYFYWGKGACEFLPFVGIKDFRHVFVRMHRYDLFEYANDGYIPYRAGLLDSITRAAPSSEAGEAHLKALYPRAKAEIAVMRCGTVNNSGRSAPGDGKVLRVVSCSFLSPVKRVHLMIESLAHTDAPILWRHIGGGALMEELKALVRAKRMEDCFILEGAMDSRKVLGFLASNSFDLFVNTSSSEGVPFSIMEAMSVGIPVMATDVGGSGEIVHDDIGVLLPANPTPQEIGAALTGFHRLPNVRRQAMRQRAFDDYREKWHVQRLTQQLAEVLIK